MDRDPGHHAWRAALGYALVFVVSSAATLVAFRELLPHFSTHLYPDVGDPRLNLVFMEWVARAVSSAPLTLWHPPFFFPNQWVLTLSDHMIGPGLQLLVLCKIGLSGPAAYNVLLLSSFPLAALSTSYVARSMGCSWWGSALAGLMFAFSPFRWDHLSHLQLLIVHWLPLVLWFWHRFLSTGTTGAGVLFLATYLLHVSHGSYLALMIHVPLLMILLSHWSLRFARWTNRLKKRELVVGTLALSMFVAIYLPYELAPEKAERSMREMLSYAANLWSYLSPSPRSWYWPGSLDHIVRPENSLFPGVAVTVGCVVLLLLWRRTGYRWPVESREWRLSLLLSGTTCGLLSIGVVYALVGRLPGFSSLRVPSRFAVIVSLVLSLSAAWALDRYTAQRGGRRKGILAANRLLATGLLLFDITLRPLPQDGARDVSKEGSQAVYRWLENQPGVTAIGEFPLTADFHQTAYMLAQTRHQVPIVNGFSGFFPSTFIELITESCGQLPARRLKTCAQKLRWLGASHIVVHLDREEFGDEMNRRARRWRRALDRAQVPELEALSAAHSRLVFADDDSFVLALDSP